MRALAVVILLLFVFACGSPPAPPPANGTSGPATSTTATATAPSATAATSTSPATATASATASAPTTAAATASASASAPPPSACPASYADAAKGATCQGNASCSYGEGKCDCELACAGGAPMPPQYRTSNWSCTPKACTTPPPKDGAACKAEGTMCGHCYGPMMECVKGKWKSRVVPPPP